MFTTAKSRYNFEQIENVNKINNIPDMTTLREVEKESVVFPVLCPPPSADVNLYLKVPLTAGGEAAQWLQECAKFCKLQTAFVPT